MIIVLNSDPEPHGILWDIGKGKDVAFNVLTKHDCYG